ncbi:MAG TPA: zinc-binding dehydrogenase [Paraburkholderia sp.]|nr:zinc-binding dehydrogenase [Paraburkholderia sp.]
MTKQVLELTGGTGARIAFDRIADAHRYMESGDQVGKIVVTV